MYDSPSWWKVGLFPQTVHNLSEIPETLECRLVWVIVKRGGGKDSLKHSVSLRFLKVFGCAV